MTHILQHEIMSPDQRPELNEAERPEVIDLSGQFDMDNDPLWRPNYGVYDRDVLMVKYRKLATILMELCAEDANIEQELEQSLDYINHSYDLFEEKKDTGYDASFAFLVPTRLNSKDTKYSAEIYPYLPILQRVDPLTRQRTFQGMCPAILDTYIQDEQGRKGVMVFTPVFEDMPNDINNLTTTLHITRKIVNDTVDFAHNKLGANIIGLGATLPKYTKLGRTINVPGANITTGHGGTVWLIGETVNKAQESVKGGGSECIGMIGLGAIGASSAEYILDDPNRRVILFDTSTSTAQKAYMKLIEKYGSNRVLMASDIRELIDKSDVTIAAITTPIGMDLDPQLADIDLTCKIIIDDSQPGCFNREEVEARGGSLAWVIGEDMNPSNILTKENGFSYGGWGPVNDKSEIWGCEAEAGSISHREAYDLATTTPISSDIARKIGRICEQSGVRVAKLQSFGQYL
ncbi:hypothetical protein HY003_04150 [Candidatus Saccharibacteria bacterium]|nr:hypothetical protein [Candidatus Saccharibacteria bacterium]MBI3338461.1 hypothetical protein [Candidatus Saccharibacteria bacterium]